MPIAGRAFLDEDERANAGIVVVAASKRGAERYLDGLLTIVREDPAQAVEFLDDAIVRALSELNRPHTPEHKVRHGRQAGGGKLKKGS